MRICCIMGVTGVGKTTYTKKLMEKIVHEEGKSRPVTLCIGKFLRETLGSDFFENLDEPGAPLETEHWVRNNIHNAIELARKCNRDLILDGFPRSKDQVDWLLLSSTVATKNIPVDFIFLFCDESVLVERRQCRVANNVAERNLMDVRSRKDAAMVSSVYGYIKTDKKYAAIVANHMVTMQEVDW